MVHPFPQTLLPMGREGLRFSEGIFQRRIFFDCLLCWALLPRWQLQLEMACLLVSWLLLLFDMTIFVERLVLVLIAIPSSCRCYNILPFSSISVLKFGLKCSILVTSRWCSIAVVKLWKPLIWKSPLTKALVKECMPGPGAVSEKPQAAIISVLPPSFGLWFVCFPEEPPEVQESRRIKRQMPFLKTYLKFIPVKSRRRRPRWLRWIIIWDKSACGWR